MRVSSAALAALMASIGMAAIALAIAVKGVGLSPAGFAAAGLALLAALALGSAASKWLRAGTPSPGRGLAYIALLAALAAAVLLAG